MNPPCSVSGCIDLARHRGLCGMHYARLLRTGEVGEADRRKPGPRPRAGCDVNGCELPHRALGLCNTHYLRHKYDKQERDKPSEAKYRVVQIDGRLRREHRVVMERVIGRPLHPWENVHHINGMRGDNRPENLELWVIPQPSGQRAVDLARWVADTYPELVRAVAG